VPNAKNFQKSKMFIAIYKLVCYDFYANQHIWWEVSFVGCFPQDIVNMKEEE
jgi:hypothetical protein